MIADPNPLDTHCLQEKQKKDAEAAASGKAIKQTAGELRLQKGKDENNFKSLMQQLCCLSLE